MGPAVEGDRFPRVCIIVLLFFISIQGETYDWRPGLGW